MVVVGLARLRYMSRGLLLAALATCVAGAQSVRLRVEGPGWHEMPLADLGLPANAAPALTCQGRRVPVLVRNGRLCFHGLPRGWDGSSARDRYGIANVYWVGPGEGPALRAVEGTTGATGSEASITEHFEVDTECGKFLFAPETEPFDHWTWSNASVGRPCTVTIEPKHRPVGGRQVRLRVVLRGRTSAEAEPDHHTVVRAAGQVLEDARWDGQAEHVAEGTIPAEQFGPGPVTVEVGCPGDTAARDVDSVALNYVRATYPIRLQTPAAQQVVSVDVGEAGAALTLERSQADLDVAVDVTDPANPALLPITRPEGAGPVVHCPPELRGTRAVLLVAAGSALQPTVEHTAAQPDLHALPAADYLVVTDPSLAPALEPLVKHREAEGLTVAVAFAADIYDQYSCGLLAPEAIRAFVADQYERAPAEHKPRFLLLAGDANYDYRDALKTGVKNLVPAMLLRADGTLETAVDAYFASLTPGTTDEALAVGRIPARTPQEVASYVAKVLDCEATAASGAEPWLTRLAVVADHDLPTLDLGRYEDGAASFGRAMAANRALSVTQLFVRTFLGPDAVTAEQRHDRLRARMTPAILDMFREGALFVSYRGHGGEWGWSRDKVLLTEDVAKLKGEARTIVLDTSCFTGWFDNPLTDPPWSIDEAMLFSECPVVACVAPSRLGGDLIDEGTIGALYADPTIRLGEAMRLGRKAILYGQNQRWAIAHSYCLLGDPALKVALKLPPATQP